MSAHDLGLMKMASERDFFEPTDQADAALRADLWGMARGRSGSDVLPREKKLRRLLG